MEEWGLLGIYKNLGEIATHENKIIEARQAIQLESAALQSSTNVNLRGDFALENFNFITSNYGGRYLSSGNSNGDIVLTDISLPNWVASNYMHEVHIDRFQNDKQLVGIHDDKMSYSQDVNLKHNDFIYSENLMNMKNRPSFDEIKDDYGYTGELCKKNVNLHTLVDKYDSRFNLGIGNISVQNEDYVYLKNMNTLDQFYLPHYFNDIGYLRIDNNSKLRNHEYNFPFLHHEIPSGYGKTSNVLPSMRLMSNVSQLVACNIDDTARYNKEFMASNQALITDLIYKDTLFTSDNLMSNTSQQEKEACRNNISIGNLSTQNSNDIRIVDIELSSNLMLSEHASNVFFDNAWITIDTFRRTNSAHGHLPSFVTVDNTLTIDKSSTLSEEISNNISNLEGNANLSFNDFGFNLFHVNCNLEGLTDLPLARAELELNPVAVTGRLKELSRRPVYLSELENDVNYYKRLLNLADVHDRFLVVTRQNIGVSNMAVEDADNIGGTEGLPLGVANRKFHSTDCVLNTVVAEKEKFILKSLDLTTEAGHDFLCVERHDKDIRGIKNFKYRYKKIDKCDEEYFTGPFVYDQSQHVRVKINDLSTANLLGIVGDQDTDFDAVRKDYVVAEYFVPSCKFSYDKFTMMASNILSNVGIPVKYFRGELDSIEYFNRQF